MKDKKSLERPDFDVLRSVFYYCFAIIVCPVSAFFGSKIFVFEGFLGLNNVLANVYAAVSAVIILHIALAMFIYKAYSDPAQVQKPSKQD